MKVPILEAQGVEKRFGHVEALRGADLKVHAGEVVGLVGDNGAGKSTLIKTLSGWHRADRGEVRLDGRAARLATPAEARRLGIETVYQDLALAPDLDAVENLYLGCELARGRWLGKLGVLDRGRMRREAPQILDGLGVRLDVLDVAVGNLSGGQRQIIAVARALAWTTKLVLMDEPTAALDLTHTEQVDRLIRAAAAKGIAVIVISHDLPELLALVDRVVVMRLGRIAADIRADEATTTVLLRAMTGLAELEQ